MSVSPELYDDDYCMQSDYAFATVISPDKEEATELATQDLCEAAVNGDRCYFRLSDPDARRCEREAAGMEVIGNLLTGVLFEGIVERQLGDDQGLDETPEA